MRGRRVTVDPTPGTRDGRNVDTALGLLAGEGSVFSVKKPGEAYPTSGAVLPRPASLAPAAVSPTYYDLPVLKESVWSSAIPAYFYVGGLAGAASVVGTVAHLAGGGALEPLSDRLRWVATLGDFAGTALLIADLGRPDRFLHMLRVFRPSSPMSVGSWVLAGSAASNTVALLLRRRRGVLGAAGRAAHLAAGILGLPLAGYTGVLLACTTVPVWQGARRTLPVLFVASSCASLGALFDLLPHELPPRAASMVRRFGAIGTAAEITASFVLEREAGVVPRVTWPLHQGVSGFLWRASRAASAMALASMLLPGARRRRRLTGLLGTLGALGLRLAMHRAGIASARDPRATFEQQRARLAPGSAES